MFTSCLSNASKSYDLSSQLYGRHGVVCMKGFASSSRCGALNYHTLGSEQPAGDPDTGHPAHSWHGMCAVESDRLLVHLCYRKSL